MEYLLEAQSYNKMQAMTVYVVLIVKNKVL